MIHVDFKVRLEDLGKLVWLLDSQRVKVFDFSQRAVRQAAPQRNGKVKSTVPAGSSLEVLTNELRRRKVSSLGIPGIKDILQHLDLSPNSYSHFIRELIKAKVLKATKTRGYYTVL